MRGDSRAVRTFIRSRFSRLLQRAAGGDLPKMAGRWARRGRLPWLLSRDPVFETELNMRLLIRAAVPWTQWIESELPPLDCPSLLVRGTDDEAFDGLCVALPTARYQGRDRLACRDPAATPFSGGRWPDQGRGPRKRLAGDGSGRERHQLRRSGDRPTAIKRCGTATEVRIQIAGVFQKVFLGRAAAQPGPAAYQASAGPEETVWLCPIEDRSQLDSTRRGMLEGFSLGHYLAFWLEESATHFYPAEGTPDCPDCSFDVNMVFCEIIPILTACRSPATRL